MPEQMDATPLEHRANQQTSSNALLQRDEWDFRSVRKSELMTVLLYEYTRSSESTCRAIMRWQSQKFDLTCLEVFKQFDDNELLGRTARETPNITNAQAVDLIFDPNGSSGTAEAKDHLSWQLELSVKAALGRDFDTSIALRFTHLNEPWAQLQKRGQAYLEVRCLPNPPRDAGLVGNLGSSRIYESLFDLDPMLEHAEFIINWTVPVGDIIKDFKAWANANRRPIPAELKRKPGKKAPWQRLKWLAAYRIAKGGYRDYDAALKFLNEQIRRKDGDDPTKVLPRYPYKKSWDDAVSNARALLENDFVQSIESLFGLHLGFRWPAISSGLIFSELSSPRWHKKNGI